MAKIPVRVTGEGFKGLRPGTETTMSISRARDAVATGRVEYVNAAKAAKKTARKAPAKKAATKAVRGSRNRSMAGKTQDK